MTSNTPDATPAHAASPYRAWFACTRCDTETYDLFDTVYRCRDGEGLLEVRHDLAALRATPAADWKSLFDARFRLAKWPYGSGIWGKKEWVLPQIPDDHIVSLFEGATGLLFSPALTKSFGAGELFVKQCGNAQTGSFKDLGMTVLVSAVNHMVKLGKPIRAVACASTGDTSAALAAYCAAAGIPSIVFLPRGKISTAQLLQPLAHGSLVLSLDTDFDGCMALIQELTTDETIYLANSMNSLRVEGQKTISIEITQQLQWQVPDWVVIPGGNLGNVSALAKGFLEMHAVGLIDKLPRICVAQAERANPLYTSYLNGFRDFTPITAGETQASAIRIGNPVSREKAIAALTAMNGVVEQASESELAAAAAEADRAGFYACPHTGVALAATKKLCARGVITTRDRVVVISTAHGLKFTEQKVAYHEQRIAALTADSAALTADSAASSPLAANPYAFANEPVHCAPTRAAVTDAVARRFGG